MQQCKNKYLRVALVSAGREEVAGSEGESRNPRLHTNEKRSNGNV
jgi:hypothetical protein